MRKALRWLAAAVALAVVALWLVRGHHTGWTRNALPYQEKDPVTEIEVTRFRRGWIPGLDFLALGFAAACALAGGSFFFRRPRPGA